MTTKILKKRKLTNIDFSAEGCHVALVGPEVGGPATGWTTLVTKAVGDVSDADVETADVRLEMDMEDFLQVFFNMYYCDAQALAQLLGYKDADEESDDYYGYNYTQNYIDEKLEGVTLLKSLANSDDLKGALSSLTVPEYLSVKKDQHMLEKALSSLGDIKILVQKSKEEKSLKPEQIEAATKVAVEKAVEPIKAELLKANEKLAQYEADEKAKVEKAREAALTEAVGEVQAKELVVTLKALDDAAFNAVLKSLGVAQTKEKEMPLFKELGIVGDGNGKQVIDATSAMIQKKYSK